MKAWIYSLIAVLLLGCACTRSPNRPEPDENGSTVKEQSPSAPPATTETPEHDPYQDMLAIMGYHGDEAYEAAAARNPGCPGADDGAALVGIEAREWHLTDWLNSKPLTLDELRGRVVVVRFWTMGCPFCKKSMPALQSLSAEFRGQPVTFIGAFHAKPADSVSDMTEPEQVARQWKVSFPIAFDREWKTLRSWWLDSGHRHATSTTFVIGKDGRILHIHPGPVFHPSDDPAEAKQNRDFLALRDVIRAGLAQ